MITTDTFLPSVLKKECGAKVKISFATDSPINGDQKSVFSEISKKNEQYKKRIARFFLQFLKPTRLLSQPPLYCYKIISFLSDNSLNQ